VLQLAVDNDKLPLNPARGVRLPKLKVEKKARVPFDKEDLRKIFKASVFTAGERPEAGAGEAAYWLPLIALFTGARMSEIGQLRMADVKCESRIHYFDITDDGEESGIKTESSRRRVPIHPELVRLGLLKYVADLQKRGEERLFPEIKADRMGVLTGNWSKWWGRYMRKKIGITDERKVFHSFRHTFKDACRAAGIGQEIHDALTGHADGENEGRNYGAGQHPLRPLAEAIKKVRYPGLKL
jgi:integrase